MCKKDQDAYNYQVDSLAESIKEKGFLIKPYFNGDETGRPNVPVVHIDSLGYILLDDGNHRVKAAFKLGLKKIPIIFNSILILLINTQN